MDRRGSQGYFVENATKDFCGVGRQHGSTVSRLKPHGSGVNVRNVRESHIGEHETRSLIATHPSTVFTLAYEVAPSQTVQPSVEPVIAVLKVGLQFGTLWAVLPIDAVGETPVLHTHIPWWIDLPALRHQRRPWSIYRPRCGCRPRLNRRYGFPCGFGCYCR